MSAADDLLHTLRTWQRQPAGELCRRLDISRATLMRAVQALGPAVVSRGQARRSAYAARRAVRGSTAPLPLYRVDPAGKADEVARLYPLHPAGCAVDWLQPPDWPLDDAMRDGWFDGLPYPLDDLRPQGFLGRHFARRHAALMQVADDPRLWSEDDLLHTLSLLGADQPGCYILGEAAYRLWQAQASQPAEPISDAKVDQAYPALADEALAQGVAGSSAGGEFPKFTTVRQIDGQPGAVIVKFSGADRSAGSRRWADLLVCEHLALGLLASQLQLPAAKTEVHQAGGRCFLQVQRFDRHGARGRSALCSWAALNAALVGQAGRPWTQGADALQALGLISPDTQLAIHRLWHFGQLIGNSDMHDGNLSFRPGKDCALSLAPAYDMLPMQYAPQRGVDQPDRPLAPPLPLPAERAAWQDAAVAAAEFWQQVAADARVSKAFRQTAAQNARIVSQMRLKA